MEEQPFTLAIAGYGTGKSHLGLTLANLINAPQSESAANILSALNSADYELDEGLVTSMAAETANKLLHQLSFPPLYLTVKDLENLNVLKQKVIQRLSELNIEWLIEKFKELSMAKQTEFIELATELIDI